MMKKEKDEQHQLIKHIEERERSLVREMNDVQFQLQDMMRMAKYAGPEAFDDVMDLLNASAKQDEELKMQVDTEVVPQTEHWRKGIGEVLDWFGLGVDYDAILAQAENSFAKTMAMQDTVGGANGA